MAAGCVGVAASVTIGAATTITAATTTSKDLRAGLDDQGEVLVCIDRRTTSTAARRTAGSINPALNDDLQGPRKPMRNGQRWTGRVL